MELNKILSSVSSLNDYISATENILKCVNVKIQLTMSLILNLKKVRSLEIEFFNKCEGNGAAFVVFERILKQPPSKTWRLLGKELISMVQYWLEAVRKHLIIHNPRWWTFLTSLLGFILDIKGKDVSLANTIVEQTTECLMDLACNSQLDEFQREQVLRCMNQCTADSSRELRTQMMERLSTYLVKLTAILSGCGHLPAQMGMLELLLRWLVKRQDPDVRAAMAGLWFPYQLFSKDTVDLFLDRAWRDFYQDARDFLISHNSGGALRVASVPCSRLNIGHVTLFNGNLTNDCTWLDVNVATRSITSYVDLRSMVGVSNTMEMLTVTEENLFTIELTREPGETVLVVRTLVPPQLTSSVLDCEGDKCQLRAVVGAADLPHFDAVLRSVFPGKYHGTADTNISAHRRNRSGYVVRSRNVLSLNSPSTDSTTSLAQLRDKLTALPPLKYISKGPQKISATPELPMVREVSEYDDLGNSVTKPRRFGVSVKYQSDSEVKTAAKKTRCISPVVKDNSASLLLVATLGTNDESVINDTFDKLYTNNPEFDLLDLLVEEALHNGQDKDSGIVSGKKTEDSDIVENTPLEKNARLKKLTVNRTAKSTVKGNSTTDESDADVIEDTPCYVNDRRKIYQTINKKATSNIIGEEIITYDAEKVDAFFSQHIIESNGRVFISPTLAQKINKSSSEASDDVADNNDLDKEIDSNFVFNEDIVECLNSIVDKVCSDLDKYVLRNEMQQQIDILKVATKVNENCPVSPDAPKTDALLRDDTKTPTLGAKKITSKSSKTRALKMNSRQKREKRVTQPHKADDHKGSIENTNTSSPVNTTKTLLTRNKRKLYSPKDDHSASNETPRAKKETRQSNISENSIAICYKELEMARKASNKLPRISRASTEPITSPKTKKYNDLFDQIKEKVVNDEKITVVKHTRNKKDLSVYNLSSESDDEYFKKKKIRVHKRVSSSSLESSATKRGRIVKPVNYSEKNSCSSLSGNEGKRKRGTKKFKTVKQTKPRSRKVQIEPTIDLIDERMRESKPNVLETSFVQKPVDKNANESPDPAPALKHAPNLEIIPDYINDAVADTKMPENEIHTPKKCNIAKIKKEKGNNKKTEKNTTLVTKKSKTLNKKEITKSVSKERDSSPVSPLPRLVVETEQVRKDDLTASVEASLLQKFKNIYTEIHDLNETDGTQNMLLSADYCNEDNNAIDFSRAKNIESIVISDLPSERSIATGGYSPITGHNDLDESPPNVELLEENIQPRNLDIQGMSESDAEFFINMRNQLNCSKTATVSANKTSPVVPITRKSTKERATSIQSSNSFAKVVMEKIFLEDIEASLNPATPRSDVSPKSNAKIPKHDLTRSSGEIETKVTGTVSPRSNTSSSKVVLTRMSSEEIKKYLSPGNTQQSRSTGSQCSIVLNRVSSDEINRWLPIPKLKCKDNDETPKKYNTRRAASKPKSLIKRSPNKATEKKIKSVISPVKLTFNISDITKTTDRVNKEIRSSKSVKSRATVEKKEETIAISQKSTDTKTSGNRNKLNDTKNISQDTVLKLSAETTETLKKDKLVSSVDPSDIINIQSENSKSIGSVQEWFMRNVTASSSTKVDNGALKDLLHKMLETLETTLVEIHQSTGENLTQYFLEYQKKLNDVKEDIKGIKQKIECIEQELKEGACKVIRADADKKVVMVSLLREDLQATLDFMDKQNK